MADRTTRTTPAPVVSAREALEFLSRAGFVLADSLDYEQTLARVVDLVVPQIADWCGVYIADGDGTEREITSRHADPDLERMLVEIRRRRREEQDGSGDPAGAPQRRPILATDVTGTDAPDLSESQRANSSGSARAPTYRPARARGRDRRAHPAVDPRGPPLPRAGRRLRARRSASASRWRSTTRASTRPPSAPLGLLDTLFRRPRSGWRSSTATAATCASNEALAAMNGRRRGPRRPPVDGSRGRWAASSRACTGAACSRTRPRLRARGAAARRRARRASRATGSRR